MSRVQLALNVDDLDRAVAFYATLFGAEPAKRRPGYANFAIEQPPLKLVLLEGAGAGGTINHLGIEVDSSDAVHAEIARLSQAGLCTEEQRATTCCFAQQDKAWVTGPHGEKWEVYTVLADSETFGATTQLAAEDGPSRQACCDTADATPEGACCTAADKRAAIAAGATCCR